MGFLPKFFGESKTKSVLSLVFDIGSSSVGGALFFAQKPGVPQIIYSVRESIGVEEKVDPDRFLFLTLKALERVAGRICLSGLGAPKHIFCVLSSPWYASQTRLIKFSKNTPFTFTQKLADELITKETELFKGEHSISYANAENTIRQLEFKSMKTVLNGYPAPNPINQKAKDVEITIFISMSSEQVLGKIEEIIFRHFHSKNIKFSSFTMVSFAVVRDMFSHQEDFLTIDIGGEVTDIAMVKKDMLAESISFPFGRNFLIRGVASALNISIDEAKSLLSLYKDNHAEGATFNKLEPIISKLKIEWLRNFQESLSNLSKDIALPSVVFITIEQDMADFFSEIIKTEQFNQYSLTDSKFEVIFLGAKVLHGSAIFKGDLPRDPFIALESIYINRFLC